MAEHLHTAPSVANTNRAVDQRGEEATGFVMVNTNGSQTHMQIPPHFPQIMEENVFRE